MGSELPDFGRGYAVQGKLGEGGFGAVYRARQVDLDRPVAIKVVHQCEPADVERFLREGQAVSRMRHPAIVQVYAVDRLSTGQPFLVFEWVDGRELAKEMEENPLAGARVLEVFRQLMEGLEHAHDRGVMHRDIKPQNLLLPNAGGLKIADFGLARLHESREKLTRTGVVMGTPVYMSPEQSQGLPIDHRSDLYSAGILLHELIAGAPPFVSENAMDVLRAHILETPPPVTDRTPGCPPALVALVGALLAKKPDDRPKSARAVLDRLDELDAGEVAAMRQRRVRTGRAPVLSHGSGRVTRPASVVTPPPPAPSLAVPIAAGVALALAVSGGAWYWTSRPPVAASVAPVAAPLAITTLEPRPPSGLRVELDRAVGAKAEVTAESDRPLVTLTTREPTRAIELEGLWPDTAYRVTVRDGAATATAAVTMPAPYRAHYESKSTEDSITLMIHPRPRVEERLLDVTVTPVDTASGKRLTPVLLQGAERMLCTLNGLQPNHRYRLEFAPAARDHYMASYVETTLSGTPAAAGLRTLERIARDGATERLLPGESDFKDIEKAVDERHAPLLVEVLTKSPPSVASDEFRFSIAALAKTFQCRHFPLIEKLMRTPGVGDLSQNTRYELHKSVGWMQCKQAFDLLTGWPEFQVNEDPGHDLYQIQDAFWEMVKQADNLAWALALSDRRRVVSQFKRWAATVEPPLSEFKRVAMAHAAARTGDAHLCAGAAVFAASSTPAVAQHVARCLTYARAPVQLRDLLTSKDAGVRAIAVQGLGHVGAAADAVAVAPLLEDPEPAVRAQAIYATFNLTRGQSRDLLVKRLESSVPEATAAAWALGELGDATTADALVAALAKDTGGRAARALGRLRHPRAFEPLRALLRDTRRPPPELAEAAWALGQLGDARAIAELRELPARPGADRFLRLRAAEAWLRLDPGSFQPFKVPAYELEDFEAMRQALRDQDRPRELFVDAAFPLRTGIELPFGQEFHLSGWGAWSLERRPAWDRGIAGLEKRFRPFGQLGQLMLAFPEAYPRTFARGAGTMPGAGELVLFCQRDLADTVPVGFVTVRLRLER